jgi:hypothetical protein
MGMFKEKFAVQPNCPVEYFANKVQTFAPEMAKSNQIKDDNGKVRWVYPSWGRTAWRVLYNSAIYNDFGLGVHVLDLPQSGGASVIDEYVRGKQADGSSNPDLTDYEHAIIINVKLDLKAVGQPWKIQINPSKTYPLPTQLADTDYLYNLDEVITYPDKNTLIDKLKSLVPTDIFRKGMEGYSDGTITVSMAATQPKTATVHSEPVEGDQIPMVFENPIPTPIPKATIAPTINIPKTTDAKTSIPTPDFTKSNSEALKYAQAYLRDKK